MTDLEQALEHERAKVIWLCEQLERLCDGRHHDLEAGKTAGQWEMLAEFSLEMDRQRDDEWKK